MMKNALRTATLAFTVAGLTACGGSKKAVDNNTWLNVGSTSGWYSKTNILDGGTRSVNLYSSPDLFQKNNPGATEVYRFRFNSGLVTDVAQQSLNGNTAADTPMTVQTPYYFVKVDNKNVLGLWAVDKFRIFLVESFIAPAGTGNYQMHLRQLQ